MSTPLRVAFLVALSAPALQAQELFGTLRRADGAPAAGVIVTATRLADGTIIGRAITGERGTYQLTAVTDRLVIRALRIGQQPHVLDTVQLAASTRRELSATLPDMPVVIATIRTHVDSRCRARPDGAETVAQLFDEARKALLASRLVSSEGVPTARFEVFTEARDRRDRLIGNAQRRMLRGTSARPFQSVPVETLVREGYVIQERDGSSTWRAPDADVLISDRFLADHCLRLVEGTGERAAWIGVGFEPTRTQRNIVQIRGTLWLERATMELQQLEFGYTGVEPMVTPANPGGLVEYTRLETGIWFVHRWTLRMPRIASQYGMSPAGVRGTSRTLTGVQVTGGEVIDITNSAGTLYTRGDDPSDVSTDVADVSAPFDLFSCAEASTDTLSLVSGAVRNTAGAGLQAAQVRAEWREQFRHVTGTVWTWQVRELTTHSADDGSYGLCGIPRARGVLLRATHQERRSRAVTVRVPKERAATTVDLVVSARP